MDVPASPEPVAAATFLQRIGLSRLLLWAKTAWRRSDSERNRRFSYQVVVSSVTTPAEDHRTPTPEPAQQAPFEDPFEKMVQQKAEQDAMPPRASVVPEEPDKPKQPEEVEKREEPEVAEEPEEPQEVEEREEPQEVKEPEEPEEAEEQEEPEEPEEPEEQEYPTKAILRSQVHAERLRKMTEQYNLPIPDDLLAYATPPKEQSRVHRPVRMRVHRSCHRCNTMFGETRVCTGCQHRVCARCQPVQRQNYADSWSPISHDRLAADLEVDDFQGLQEQITMLRASRTSSQTLVRKELRQRVRRRCHSCSALFGSGNRTCTNCQHVCCAACPRFPPKRNKYPDGYPGDEPAPSSTAPITYACHECHQTYPPVPHSNSPEGQAVSDAPVLLECTQCGHTRCPSCQRSPPHLAAPAPAPDPDPDVLRSVEVTLAAI